MHAFFANLMSAILLCQAVLGCCWHGAWWNTDRSSSSNVCASESCCSHSHSRQQAPIPHKCELKCCAARIFIPTQKTLIDSPDTTAYQNVLLVEPGIEILLGESFWRGWLHGTLNESPPPLDLHLVHQVFLI